MGKKIETITFPFTTVPKTRVYIKQMDTIPAVTITLSNNAPFIFTGGTIKMQLYKGDNLILDLGTDVGGITITGERTATIDRIEAADNNLPFGVLEGDFVIRTSAGEEKTYCDVEYHILERKTRR